MSKKANPTVIGLFIIVGLALGVIGLVLFSSTKLFTKTRQVILYFSGLPAWKPAARETATAIILSALR